jgi:hypothetical protein
MIINKGGVDFNTLNLLPTLLLTADMDLSTRINRMKPL